MSRIRTISFLLALLAATACGDGADPVTAPSPGVQTPRAYVASVPGSYTQVSARSQDTCVVGSGGTLTCWGLNDWGQATVPASAQNGVTQVSVGVFHTCALGSGGAVTCWGYNGSGQTTVPAAAQSGVTQVSAGQFHNCALGSWQGLQSPVQLSGRALRVQPLVDPFDRGFIQQGPSVDPAQCT